MPMKARKLKTKKAPAWLAPMMAKTTPATMLTAPSPTIPRRLAGASEKLKWRKPARQDCPLGVVPVVVGNAPVEVVDDPDLQGGEDQVEDQADQQGLGQPRIAALCLGDAPDDDPSDGEQGNRDEECDERLGLRAAVRWALGHDDPARSGLPLGVLDDAELVERRRRDEDGGS